MRAVELLRRLARNCDVHVLIAIGGSDDPAQREFLSNFCKGVHFHQVESAPPRLELEALPGRVRALSSWLLAQRVRGLAFGHDIDIVQLENSDVASLAGLPTPARTVLVALDLTFRSVARRSAVWGSAQEHREREERFRWLRIERAAWRGSDQVHFVSECDRALASRFAPEIADRARVVPNGASIAPAPVPSATGEGAEAGAVLFVGSFPHVPNREALRYLVSQIWPRVRAELPRSELIVVGAGAPAWVLELDGREGIRVAGEAETLESWYLQAAVSAVPILSGSGTRLKILESLAHSVPVVSTSVGAEGLDGIGEGVGLRLADDAASFALRLTELLQDSAGRAALARRGRAVVEARYGWDRIVEGALACYRELPAAVSRSEVVIEDTRGEARPEISVIVDALAASAELESVLEALGRQIEQRFEILCLVRDGAPSPVVPDALRGRWLELRGSEPPYGAGRLARTFLRHGRGRIVAFLDARLEPANEHWLAHLTWPLFQLSPPSAVEGRTVDRAGLEVVGPRLLDGSVQKLSSRFVGTGFSFLNSATRRSFLETFPPAGEGNLAALAWTLVVTRTGGWILQEEKALAVARGADSENSRTDAPVAVSTRDSRVCASVIVCTRDRADDLEVTLSALIEQRAEFSWEILVVDNGSSDDTLRRAALAGEESAVPIRTVVEPIVGLSAARNAGARLANGKWIIYLDDDAIPACGWLTAFAVLFDRDDFVAAGGPVDPWLSGTLPFWLRHEYLPYLSVWDLGPSPVELSYNEYPRGANMAVQGETLRRIGGFSRQLGRSGRSLRSCEEIELFLRIERDRGRIAYLPAARVFHRIRAERLTVAWFRRRYAAQGFSEAVIDWRHGGFDGLRAGLVRARSWLDANGARGGLVRDLDRSFHRAAARAYRRGAIYSLFAVARLAPHSLGRPAVATAERR